MKKALPRLLPKRSKEPRKKQEAVILRVELGFSHQQVADALGLPSANTARMQVARALVQLSEDLDA